MRIFLTAAAVAVLPIIAHANAAEDTIEARHGFMKMLAINMGQLAGMAKGEIGYDEDMAVAAATNIQALTGYDLPSLFIAGTSSDENPESDALPVVWEKPEEFSNAFMQLREAAAGAPDAVKGGQANVGPALQKLGTGCKNCHDTYRKPQK